MAFSYLIRRGLSTTALRYETQLVKTPIPMFGLSGNYAEALYSAASKLDAKDNVAKDLVVLGELLQSQKISDYMNDPFTKSEQKLGLLKEVAEKGGMANTSVNFFGVLAENNRLDLVGEITGIFARLMSAERGEVPAEVITAQPLDKDQRAEVLNSLNSLVNENENVILQEKVDPSILGGMVVSIGDKYTNMKYIDMSTATKIKTYLDLIKQPA